MTQFNLTTIRPSGFLHSSGFNEVKDSLAWSLSALGHATNVTENWLTRDATNIIFGTELLAPNQKLLAGSIIFNLEQPSHPNMAKVKELAKGLTVWDFSLTNVKNWQAAGYDVKHVPIGYTPNLTRIPTAPIQDIDILIYGWMTPRRLALVEKFKKAGFRIYATDHCYGGGRDNLISRSKIIVNVHHDDRDLFEIVRVSYLLANHKAVVSEHSSDWSDYRDLIGSVWTEDYSNLVEVCSALTEANLGRIRETGFDAFRKRDFTATLAKALGQEWPPLRAVEKRYRDGYHEGDMKAFLPWLRSHAKGNILEIGVRDGASTSAFLLGLEANGGHLYSIDIADCSHLFKGHPQWTFKQMNSRDWPSQFEAFNLILIDGDHTRTGYSCDLALAEDLIKPGGLILTHDIDPQPGLTLEAHPGSDKPSIAIREEYFNFIARTGWKHEELPGENGMGILYAPPAMVTDSDESWQASEALLK